MDTKITSRAMSQPKAGHNCPLGSPGAGAGYEAGSSVAGVRPWVELHCAQV